MKEYTIVRKAPWEVVPELTINECTYEYSADITAYCKVCYDDDNLYVRLRAHEKDIRAEGKKEELLAQPCEDSCLEFFFSPDASDRYFNIEYNPNCLRFLGFGTHIWDLVRLLPLHDETLSFDPVTEYLPDGWQITYHIPYKFIRMFFPGFAPKKGDFMTGNAFTTGDFCKIPHDLSWNPIDPEVYNSFHNPKAFGKLWFG